MKITYLGWRRVIFEFPASSSPPIFEFSACEELGYLIESRVLRMRKTRSMFRQVSCPHAENLGNVYPLEFSSACGKLHQCFVKRVVRMRKTRGILIFRVVRMRKTRFVCENACGKLERRTGKLEIYYIDLLCKLAHSRPFS